MRFLTDLKKRLADPRATRRWLASCKPARDLPGPWFADSIALASIVRWDGWHGFNQFHRLDCGTLPPPDLGLIAVSGSRERYSIDLRDIAGIGSSKGPIRQLTDLRSLAMRLPSGALEFSRGNLARLLSHDQIRVSVEGDGRDGDSLYRFGWEPGYWIGNHGGSHHLAAAIVVAREIDAHVCISAPLYHHRLDPGGIRQLTEQWQSYLIPFEHLSDMADAFETDRIAFAVTTAPDPFRSHFAVHLERHDPRSRTIGPLLAAGFCDLSQAASAVLARQEDLERR